jgi:hypothetical protein
MSDHRLERNQFCRREYAKQGSERKPESAGKILEARLRAQGVQARIEAEERSRQRAFGVGLVEFIDCFIPFVEAGVDER